MPRTISEKRLLLRAAGRRLRQARKKLGLTQEAFAQSLGMPQQQLSKYETGQCQPGTLWASKIARALDLQPGDIWVTVVVSV